MGAAGGSDCKQELVDKAKTTCERDQAADPGREDQSVETEDVRPTASKGDADEAENQDQAAANLDRGADELTKAVDLAKDPRSCARQLARLGVLEMERVQDELKKVIPLRWPSE